MNSLIARIALELVAGFAAFALLVIAVERTLAVRKARRKAYERKHRPWDPALCPHEWERRKSRSCNKNPSDWTADGSPKWRVDVCTHCKTRHFTCSFADCARYKECRAEHEAGSPESGRLRRELIDRVADAHSFEYSHYWLHDSFGNKREGWCRMVPTAIPFACPDCGGMVVGVGASRVWPGTTGNDPEAYRCERCGRQEDHEFGETHVATCEGRPVFVEPRGAQPVCPCGGKHWWKTVEEWSEFEFPEGVDPYPENLNLLEKVTHKKLRCERCGELKTV